MNVELMKRMMDACYLAKRARDLLPTLPNGVTSSHVHYLDTIRKLELKTDSVRVSDISDKLGLPKPGVTKTVKEMEKLGLVEKHADKTDGRVVFLKITAAGNALLDEYVDELFGKLSRELGDVSDEDADAMIETVEKLYRVMRKRAE